MEKSLPGATEYGSSKINKTKQNKKHRKELKWDRIILIFAFVNPANIYLACKWTLLIGPRDAKVQANNFPNRSG